MAKRIQRRRVKGWKMPPNARYVGRGTKWGNPYSVRLIGLTEWVVYEWDEIVGEKTRLRTTALLQCLELYREWTELQIALEPTWLDPLRGKDLACWCGEADLCHADILLDLLANAQDTPDALAAHWPTLDDVPEGEDRFSQYPISGGNE